jgi:hypothetical protein
VGKKMGRGVRHTQIASTFDLLTLADSIDAKGADLVTDDTAARVEVAESVWLVGPRLLDDISDNFKIAECRSDRKKFVVHIDTSTVIDNKIRPPVWLDDEGKKFFKRHLQHCLDNGSLTEETLDTYAMMCRMWSLSVKSDPDIDSKNAMKFTSFIKYFQTYAKPFGLFGSKAPPGKKAASIADVLKEVLNHAPQDEAPQETEPAAAPSDLDGPGV